MSATKKNRIIAGGILGTFVLGLCAILYANITTLGTPGAAGRPAADTITNFRVEGAVVNREVLDTSAVQTPSAVTTATVPINITFTAGLSFAKGYVGPYTLNLYNAGSSPVFCYVNLTPTAMNSPKITGTVVAAGTSAQIQIGNYDGVTAHLAAVSTPGQTVNYSVSTR